MKYINIVITTNHVVMYFTINRYQHECTTCSLIIVDMYAMCFHTHGSWHSHQQCPALSWRIPSATRIRHAFSTLSIPSQCFCKNSLVPSFNCSKLAFSNSTATAVDTEAHFRRSFLTHLNEQLCPATFLSQTLLANSAHQSSIGLANPLLRNCLPQLRQLPPEAHLPEPPQWQRS